MRRTRSPDNVVREMKTLHDQLGVSIFLFQDDGFSVLGRGGRRWALHFVDELERQGLRGRVIWKIICRADEVDASLFATLRDAGLYLAYLGLESGNEAGLKVLNKQLTVEDNVQAVSTLKELGLRFAFGFMLFDPSSTFETVRANVAFLRRIAGDGSAAATFCKMLPYSGTNIEEQLAADGRLRGTEHQPDYDFLDPRLDAYYEFLVRVVASWTQGPNGVSPQLNWAWHEVEVVQRLFPPVVGLETYKGFLHSITKTSNDLLFAMVEETSFMFENGAKPRLPGKELEPACQYFVAELLRRRNEFIWNNQDVLLGALTEEPRAAFQT